MREHLPVLDGLRGLAAGLVLFFHLSVIFGWGTPLISYGYLGVDLFFVLSGFLLALPWLKAHAAGGAYSWRTYARRRLFRIVPAYYACVALLALLRPPLPFGQELPSITPDYLLGQLLFATNGPGPHNLNGVFWSLGTEMQFYVVLPLLVRAFYGSRWSLGLLASVMFAVWWRWQMLATGMPEAADYLNTVMLPARLDAFGLGIAAAAIWMRVGLGPRPKLGAAMSGLGVLLLTPAFVGIGLTSSVFSSTLVAAGFALVVLGAMCGSGAARTMWQFRPLRVLGTIAYSVYLWHLPLIVLAFMIFGAPPGIAGVLMYGLLVLGVLGVSTVSYWLTERPFLDGGRCLILLVTRLRNSVSANSPRLRLGSTFSD